MLNSLLKAAASIFLRAPSQNGVLLGNMKMQHDEAIQKRFRRISRHGNFLSSHITKRLIRDTTINFPLLD